MVFQEILPSFYLRPYVRNFLLVHLPVHHVGTFTKPYPVRIEQALVFFIRGYIKSTNPQTGRVEKIPRMAIFGQQIERLNFETHFVPDFMMLMIVFQPGVLERFIKVPLAEVNEQFCDAELFLGQGITELYEKFIEVKNYHHILGLAETYLTGLLVNIDHCAHPIDKLGLLLLNSPIGFSIDKLASDACLGPRQFQRKFNEHFGIGPKLYMRINRYFNALRYKEQNPNMEWIQIALLFGYTDYSHLYKEFKELGGAPPSLLLFEDKPEDQVPNILLPPSINFE